MFRSPTIWRRFVIRPAISGATFAIWFSASPMISSWRSTAECSNSSRANSSTVLSRMNAAMWSAALRTSQRNARGSPGIHRGAMPGDVRTNVRVGDRLWHDEIDWSAQERFEPLLEAEVGVQPRPLAFVQELNEEVHVASACLEIVPGGGAEEVESAYPETPAQLGDARAVFVRHLVHATNTRW